MTETQLHQAPADAEAADTLDMNDDEPELGPAPPTEPQPESESASESESEPEPELPPIPKIDPVILALRAELAAKDEQLRAYITAYKQATADMGRERDRMAAERETIANVEKMAIAGPLLDVLDNLDRSIAGCTDEEMAAGLRLVRGQFSTALSGLGVEPIVALGATFDASLHEAAGMIPAMGGQRDQEIIFEERSGYTFDGKLLRAARVLVASRSD
jgi:molecular chaperone GrpE